MPTITLPQLHPGQADLYNTPGRFMAVRCGRRWGKTQLASVLIGNGVPRGEYWGVFVPGYKLIAEQFRELHKMLEPIVVSASKMEGVIRCLGGGRVDFWSLDKERAGRSRKYHGVIIDEAAFVEGGFDFMDGVWKKAIKPTLLDYRGVAWAMSTPAGVDEDSWFYHICNDPDSEFVEYHAPTSTNPYLPEDEVAKLKEDNSPEVYRQEYLAEFVDWSGVSFFPVQSLLVNGAPVPMPKFTGSVFAVVDTAIKSGLEHNSTAVLYGAYDPLVNPKAIILDWDLVQIEGADQAAWLPTVYARCEELARECKARNGSLGVLMEDKATGTVLIQQARNLELAGMYAPVTPIESKLTAMGKDERAIAASPHVYQGNVKISELAFNKTKVHKRISANHFIRQVTGFRIGAALKDGLDCLDTFTYFVLMTCGTAALEAV